MSAYSPTIDEIVGILQERCGHGGMMRPYTQIDARMENIRGFAVPWGDPPYARWVWIRAKTEDLEAACDQAALQ